jgi:hypothetical protein
MSVESNNYYHPHTVCQTCSDSYPYYENTGGVQYQAEPYPVSPNPYFSRERYHSEDSYPVSPDPYVGREKYQAEVPYPVSPDLYFGIERAMAPAYSTSMTDNDAPAIEKKRKGVSFKPTATVRTFSSRQRKNMTKEEKSRLYYSKEELNIFSLEAKAICTLSQDLPGKRNSGTLFEATDSCTIGSNERGDEVDSLRGLELLVYPRRTQNKLLAQKSLLKYQAFLNTKPGMTEERKSQALAMASTKLTLWSSVVAAQTAQLDALRAYEGDYLIPTDTTKPKAVKSPFSYYRQKRRGSRRITPDATSDASPQSQQSKRRRMQ